MHHSIAGHDALLVGPNGGTLCQLPTYADSLNTQVNNTLVILQPDGSAKVEVKQTSRLFQYEDKASIIDMESARQKDWLRSDINLVQAKVDAIRANEIKRKEPQLDISYTIESEQYGNKTGKRLFIPINIFHRSFYSPNNQGERTQSIQTHYGYLDIDSISIRLPEGYEIESLPKPVDQESKFGKFRSSIALVIEQAMNDQNIACFAQGNGRLYRFPGFPQKYRYPIRGKNNIEESRNYYPNCL